MDRSGAGRIKKTRRSFAFPASCDCRLTFDAWCQQVGWMRSRRMASPRTQIHRFENVNPHDSRRFQWSERVSGSFWVAWFMFMFMYVLFYLGKLSHFPSCVGAGVTNLNEPPSSFLLPPHYCGLGAGSIPFGPLWTRSIARWGVIYFAGHPLLTRRCITLPACIRLRNDIDFVGWGVPR